MKSIILFFISVVFLKEFLLANQLIDAIKDRNENVFLEYNAIFDLYDGIKKSWIRITDTQRQEEKFKEFKALSSYEQVKKAYIENAINYEDSQWAMDLMDSKKPEDYLEEKVLYLIDKFNRSMTIEKIRKRYRLVTEGPSTDKLVFFLGEIHIDANTLIRTARIQADQMKINQPCTLLIEGLSIDESSEPYFFHIFLRALTALLFEKSGRSYETLEYAYLDQSLARKLEYQSIRDSDGSVSLKDYINGVNGLKLKNPCKKIGWEPTNKNYEENLVVRNMSLANIIEKELANGNNVFVNAGTYHLPYQELISYNNMIFYIPYFDQSNNVPADKFYEQWYSKGKTGYDVLKSLGLPTQLFGSLSKFAEFFDAYDKTKQADLPEFFSTRPIYQVVKNWKTVYLMPTSELAMKSALGHVIQNLYTLLKKAISLSN